MFKSVESYYRFHARIYDITRWTILFGRKKLIRLLPNLPNGARILDVGCGTGAHLKWLLEIYPSAQIIAVDQSKEMLKIAKSKIKDDRVTFFQSNVFNLDLGDTKFNLVVGSYSLTIIQQYEKLLPLIHKLLLPNGIVAIVDFDHTPFQWFKKWMKWNHVRLSPELFGRLYELFPRNIRSSKRAYLGLWTYSIFTGFKSHKL